MQVLPIKIDSAIDQPAETDTPSATSSVEFASLMTSSDPKPATQTDSSSKNSKAKTDEDLADSKTSTDTALNQDPSVQVNFYIGQIDLANLANQVVTDKTSDLESEEMQAESAKTVTSNPQAQAFAANQRDMKADPATQAKESDKPEQKHAIEENNGAVKTDFDKEKITPENTPDIKAQKPEEKESKNTDLTATMNLQNASPVVQSTLANAVKEPFKLQDKQNKYSDSLSALGPLINGFTTQHANNTNLLSHTNIAQAAGSLSYADALRKVQDLDFNTSVELVPQSAEAALKDNYSANIKIYPPELGHIVAKLKVDKNNAELTITAENSTVKSIIEANLTQLRDNFQSADINLTNIRVDVAPPGDKEQRNNQNQQYSSNNNQNEPANESATHDPEQMMSRRALDSMVDTYV